MRDLLAFSPECCVEPPAVPPEFQCFIPELGREYCKLVRRYESQVTKNKRVLALAEPKWRKSKVQQPCICPEVALRKVEIIREQPIYTRTEQLAYPQPSRLSELKKHPSYQMFHHARKEMVNRTLRKSIMSLYSRLTNAAPPLKPPKVKKWGQSEWEEHLKRIEELAQSKPDKSVIPENVSQPTKPTKRTKRFKQNKLTKRSSSVSACRRRGHRVSSRRSERSVDLRRMKRLSKPKIYEDTTATPWQLTNHMRTYKPSKRILEMSRPKIIDTSRHIKENEPLVTPEALKYKATERIKELAKPSSVYHKPEKKQTPFVTSRKALKAKATKRVVELAEPRDYMDMNTRAHPYRVSPAALRAKLTPRLRELAKPKEYISI